MVKHTMDTIEYFVSGNSSVTKEYIKESLAELPDISLLVILDYMHSDAYQFWASTGDGRDIRWVWAFREVKCAILERGKGLLVEAKDYLPERCFSDLMGKW